MPAVPTYALSNRVFGWLKTKIRKFRTFVISACSNYRRSKHDACHARQGRRNFRLLPHGLCEPDDICAPAFPGYGKSALKKWKFEAARWRQAIARRMRWQGSCIEPFAQSKRSFPFTQMDSPVRLAWF
jgi:hypothetical protein